jgi:uncharacterized protein YjbI with pentapeptide repeats
MKQRYEENKIKKPYLWDVRVLGGAMLAIAVAIGTIGYLNQHGALDLGEKVGILLSDFYANFSTELASIAITVLLIDSLQKRHETQQHKERLIHHLGSKHNVTAVQAVDELRLYGWLRDGTLQGLFLNRANLEGADLNFSDLRGVHLDGTNLQNAQFIEANLEGAEIVFSNMIGAVFVKTNLQGAILGLKNTVGGSNLNKADMREANLRTANLSRCSVQEALLEGADFSNASLIETDLQGSDLRRTNLQSTNLLGASLDGAWLWSSQLQDSNVLDEQLVKTQGLRGAIMPNGNLYDGRFNLPGDLSLARGELIVIAKIWEFQSGENIDIFNQNAMAEFYKVSLDDYLIGQKWAESNLSRMKSNEDTRKLLKTNRQGKSKNIKDSKRLRDSTQTKEDKRAKQRVKDKHKTIK